MLFKGLIMEDKWLFRKDKIDAWVKSGKAMDEK